MGRIRSPHSSVGPDVSGCGWQSLTLGLALAAFRGRWEHVSEPGTLECPSSQPAHGLCPSPRPRFGWNCSITFWIWASHANVPVTPCAGWDCSCRFQGLCSTPRPKNHPGEASHGSRGLQTLLECAPSLLAGGAWSRKVLKGPVATTKQQLPTTSGK